MIEDTIKINDGNKSTVEVKRSNNTGTAKRKAEGTTNADNVKQHEDNNVKEAIERINDTAKFFDRKIRIEVEKDLNIMIVKVIDEETGNVIRQIPPKEIVELSKHAKDLRGLLINKEG